MPEELKRAASLSFDDGLLSVNLEGYGEKNGAGRISFTDNDLDWGDGEDAHWRFMRLPKSELEAIRDFLNEHLAVQPEKPAPRFAETFCSQCGKSFGPGDSGFSHCEHHQEGRP